ncbi:hypothetical protein EDD28_0936 [Salana multivorans]|uniref:Uncharacterized protein n=1 Tax=Salana multivorans TaxID=120377 RepID=A0A3N2D9B2_9MICO|nr:hypothetical protein [Salana multivorans]MBN8882319.1 hypothetical protein [Salana multivorans]OJX97309.1 MAG: hypothetical protein BGO96_05045 [Micrococcales bacterium 73-15]ROR96353.1 hypothetical protein EDD28_0936 [Salana multivorans]
MSYDRSMPPAVPIEVEEAAGVLGEEKVDGAEELTEAEREAEIQRGSAAVAAISDPENADAIERLKGGS